MLVEKGVVVSVSKEIAEIEISRSDNCHNCSAHLFCNPSKNNSKILKAVNTFGALLGDEVKIEIEEKAVLTASFQMYGVPILLLLIGVLLGNFIFSEYTLTEFYAFLFSIALIAIYYIVSFTIGKSAKKETLPKIIFVKRSSNN